MAEIPVHKKGGIPWWVWLLLALVLAGLLWLLLADRDDDVEPVADATPIEQPVVNDTVVGDTGPITSLATLMGAPLATMAGRQIELTGVPVESLAGDQAFYIGDSPTNRAFVAFDEKPSPNMAKEGNVDVNPGSMVTLRGTVRPASETPTGATLPAGTDAYIFADSVDVVS